MNEASGGRTANINKLLAGIDGPPNQPRLLRPRSTARSRSCKTALKDAKAEAEGTGDRADNQMQEGSGMVEKAIAGVMAQFGIGPETAGDDPVACCNNDAVQGRYWAQTLRAAARSDPRNVTADRIR